MILWSYDAMIIWFYMILWFCVQSWCQQCAAFPFVTTTAIQADGASKPIASGMILPLAEGKCWDSAAFSTLNISSLPPRATGSGGKTINVDDRIDREDHFNLAFLPQSRALQQSTCREPSKAGICVVKRQQGIIQALQVMDKLSHLSVVSLLLIDHMQQAKICSVIGLSF